MHLTTNANKYNFKLHFREDKFGNKQGEYSVVGEPRVEVTVLDWWKNDYARFC